MKGIASLLSRHARAPRESNFAQRVASRLEPGQNVEFVDGTYRILQKSASPSGMQFVVARPGGRETLSLRQIAALGPVTPAMRRLAVFVHQILAFDKQIDTYVKEAIKAAGLPVDAKMNWSKYLDKMYGTMLSKITQDEGLKDDAIRDMVIDELFLKKILTKNFNPAHPALAGKEEADKVSAYLVAVFKGRKEDVATYVRRAMGVGAHGSTGLAPTTSLDAPLDSHTEGAETRTMGDTMVNPKDDFDHLESEEEVRSFIEGFREYLQSQKYQPYTLKALNYITDAFTRDDPRDEIKEYMVNNPEFSSRSGVPLNTNGYNYALGQWVRGVREFAKDPEWGWTNSPLARLIAEAADRLLEGEKAKNPAKKPRAAALKLADFEDEQPPMPPAPPANPNLSANIAPPAVPPAAPPPPNPNVQQQQSVRNLNTVQPQNDPAVQAEDAQQGQQKLTIPPEIPGVNHTASEEQTMGVETKEATKHDQVRARIAARREARKFSRLRRVAELEPAAVGEAMTELGTGFSTMASRMANLSDHLGLNGKLAADATIRQKVAHRNGYGRGLKVLAAEEPQELEKALNDFYGMLNEAVTSFENMADNLGVKLNLPEQEDGFFDGPLDTPEEPAAEPVAEEPVAEPTEEPVAV